MEVTTKESRELPRDFWNNWRMAIIERMAVNHKRKEIAYLIGVSGVKFNKMVAKHKKKQKEDRGRTI